MKKFQNIKSVLLGLVGFTLACWPGAANAQTTTILCAPGAIQPNGDPTDITLQWGLWFQGNGGETATATEVFDPTQSSISTIPGSIHVIMSAPGNSAFPGGAANLAFGDWLVEGFGNQGWLGDAQYVAGSIFDASKYSALSFDIMVNNETSSNSDIPVYLWGEGYDNYNIGSVTVPAATTNWQHVSFPIPSTIGMADCVAWGFYDWYPNAAPFNVEFWVDNVQLVGKGVIPPPVMSISPAVQGLNLFTSGSTGNNERENIESTAGSYSWVGAANPVSFSFTISSFPIAPADYVQVQIFLCPNPGTESDPDWAEPNIVFVELDSTATGGGNWTFRYKTNQINGNSMLYGSGALASIYSTNPIGTWTVTFNQNTNVTMTTPGGTTNFSIPDTTGDTSALFASGVNLYFGAQDNNLSAANDHVVASEFKVTGSTADFDDNFVADAGDLNSNLWTVNAAFARCVQMIGPGNPYWITWTLPASGYSLLTARDMNTAWTAVTNNPANTFGATMVQLISTNDVQPGSSAFFSLVQRTFSQLQVLLAGETNAPGAYPGKVGTPTPISLNTYNQEVFTVLAVDKDFYPVTGVYDTIQITSTDGGAFLPVNNPVLANGSVQVQDFFFEDEGTFTITAADVTNTNIQSGVSTPVTVGP